jgi:mannose-6-phosphate isomerase-like protein (cupin superfamily)
MDVAALFLCEDAMKSILVSVALLALGMLVGSRLAQNAAPATGAAPPEKLVSGVFDWDKLAVTPNARGVRRAVFDGSTATLDKLHCHITTLNPGEKSADLPSLHRQEELMVVKEGLVEALWDGKSQTAGPGSVIFFASGATTQLRNAGKTPCTYIVVYYYTPLTPKN